MGTSLAELARLVQAACNGTNEDRCDDALIITGAAPLRDAEPGQITLLEDPRAADQLAASAAAAVVVPLGFQPTNKRFLAVADPRRAFTQIVEHFRPPRVARRIGVHPAAFVSPNAVLADDVDVYPGVYIGDDVRIGPGSTIHPHVCLLPGCQLAEHVEIFPHAVLYHDTIVGPRSVIHAGAVIGSYGFGYQTEAGRHHRAPQLGYVLIEADVEIGAGTTIDRATYGVTTIGAGTKIDNQVMIGHNCRIGRHNLLCSQVGIAGSATTGDYVVMAGQVGVRDHVTIGDQVTLGARSGVGSDITKPGRYFGAPPLPDREQLQVLFSLQKVPAMRQQLKEMQKRLAELEQLIGRTPREDAA